MNPGLVVKLRPSGPWRIGPDSGARNRVDLIYHSDSLFSAVTAAMSRLGWLEEWLDATARTGSPAVSFSSCFPYLGDLAFVVPPRSVWPPAPQSTKAARIRWKSARFVPLTVVQSILSGQRLDDNSWTVDGPSDCLVPAGKPGPFRTAVRSSAGVDRLTGASERHSTACIEFRPGAGLWTVVSFADTVAQEHWSGKVKGAFRLLADTGFGGERSRGWGRSDAPEFIDGMLPDLILPLPTHSAAASAGDVEVAEAEVIAVRPIAPLVAEPEPPASKPDAAATEPAAAATEPVAGDETPATKLQSRDREGADQETASPAAESVPQATETASPAAESVPQATETALPAVQPAQFATETASPAVEPVPLPTEPATPVIGTGANVPEPVSATPETEPIVATATEPALEPEPVAMAAAAASGATVVAAPEPEPQLAGAPTHPHWLLSLFTPAPADSVDWRRGNYTVTPRGGRVDSPAGSGELKKQIQMVSEGSVLYAETAPRGSAADVAPDGFAHPVFRAGFAVAIPLPEVR